MMIYLASPYKAYPHGLDKAAEAAFKNAARIQEASPELVYSPIVYCHLLQVLGGCRHGESYWEEISLEMLKKADKLYVLRLPGWEKSLGIAQEIGFAKALGLHIYYRDPL